MNGTPRYDVAVIGGGIVGIATAHALCERLRGSLVVLEAESKLGGHQSGHNSGVIHSGLYYKPGSLKARNCVEGRDLMYRLCEEHGVPHERCGKVVVATREAELPALDELERRGRANGLDGMRRLRARADPRARAARRRDRRAPRPADRHRRLPSRHGGARRPGARRRRRIPARRARRARATRRRRDRDRDAPRSGRRAARSSTAPVSSSDRVARLCGVQPGLQIIPVPRRVLRARVPSAAAWCGTSSIRCPIRRSRSSASTSRA